MRFMQAIHQKIQSLGFKDCHAKIRHVDCQETIGNAVVIQVLTWVTICIASDTFASYIVVTVASHRHRQISCLLTE